MEKIIHSNAPLSEEDKKLIEDYSALGDYLEEFKKIILVLLFLLCMGTWEKGEAARINWDHSCPAIVVKLLMLWAVCLKKWGLLMIWLLQLSFTQCGRLSTFAN